MKALNGQFDKLANKPINVDSKFGWKVFVTLKKRGVEAQMYKNKGDTLFGNVLFFQICVKWMVLVINWSQNINFYKLNTMVDNLDIY